MLKKFHWKKSCYAVVLSLIVTVTLSYFTLSYFTLSSFTLSSAAYASSDSSPAIQWEVNYGGSGIKIFDVYETDQGFTMVGTKNKKEAYLVRTDAAGTKIWEKLLDLRTSDQQQVLITDAYYTSDGGYLLGGTVPGHSSFRYIARTDEEGVVLWDKEVYSSAYVEITDIQETSDGGVIYCYNTGEYHSGVIEKLNALGEFEWDHYVQGSKFSTYNSIESVAQTSDGGYMASTFNADTHYLRKLNTSGQQVWGFYSGDGIGWITETADQGYAIVNYDLSVKKVSLFKYNAAGQQSWKKNFTLNAVARSIDQTVNEGYILGLSNAVIECDAQGNMLWSKPVERLTTAIATSDGGLIYISSYERVVKLEGHL